MKIEGKIQRNTDVSYCHLVRNLMFFCLFRSYSVNLLFALSYKCKTKARFKRRALDVLISCRTLLIS